MKQPEKKTSLALDAVVFGSGAVVMILELTGSRILAPYVGGSLPVWTALIGIILGSLSVGYYFGGKMVDQKPAVTTLASIMLIAAVLLAVTPLLSKLLLPLLNGIIIDLRVSAVISALILFAPTSILLGMISPYAIRLKLHDVSHSGEVAGRLSALSTIGSIIGTFLAGFFLIAYLGSHTILYLLAMIMLLLALRIAGKQLFKKIAFFALILGVIWTSESTTFTLNKQVVDVDTSYNRVLIYDTIQTKTGRPIREMLIGNEHSSAMYLNSNELVYDYTNYYRLAGHFIPEMTNSLMIGGAGYSYPKDFLREHPQASIDVVEIDPALTDLAKKHFALPEDKRLRIYHEDARTFLNREEKQYDAIFNDAFSSYYSHPFQLATKEAIRHMAQMLTEDGVIITNTISAIEGHRGKFLRAEYATYNSVFPYVYVFPVARAQIKPNHSKHHNTNWLLCHCLSSNNE